MYAKRDVGQQFRPAAAEVNRHNDTTREKVLDQDTKTRTPVLREPADSQITLYNSLTTDLPPFSTIAVLEPATIPSIKRQLVKQATDVEPVAQVLAIVGAQWIRAGKTGKAFIWGKQRATVTASANVNHIYGEYNFNTFKLDPTADRTNIRLLERPDAAADKVINVFIEPFVGGDDTHMDLVCFIMTSDMAEAAIGSIPYTWTGTADLYGVTTLGPWALGNRFAQDVEIRSNFGRWDHLKTGMRGYALRYPPGPDQQSPSDVYYVIDADTDVPVPVVVAP